MAVLKDLIVQGATRLIGDTTAAKFSATSIYENGVALSSKYLGISAKAADADKLDGNDSSYFQPKVSALGSSTQPIYISAAGTFSTCNLSTTYAPYNSAGYLPLNGGTMTGVLTTKGSMYDDSYSGALNMNNSNIYGLNAIYTCDAAEGAAEGLNFYRDNTHVDTFWVAGGNMYFVPNRGLGTNTSAANSNVVLHSGNSSVSLSGSTLTVKINGVEKSLTNTNTTYSAGTGLSLSGTTFNHSNSVTAQTTQGLYPIKIDAQGHISAYGSAVTSLPASDVYAWAKAATKPSYSFSEISSRGEALLGWGGTNVSGGVTPIGMCLSNEHSANRFAFIDGSCLTFEYSSNGGSTWTDYGYSNTTKSKVFTLSESIPIGRTSGNYSTNSRTRITVTAQNGTTTYVYTNPKKMLINISSSGGMKVLVEYRTGTNYLNGGAWSTFGEYSLSGWSGWNDIPLILSTLGGGTTQKSNNWQLRLTFIMTSFSSDYPTTAHLNAIRIYGENAWATPSTMATTNHLYSFDISKNAIFPAGVSATSFTENGTALSSKYLALSGGTMTGAITGTTIYSDTLQPRNLFINHPSDTFGASAVRGCITYNTSGIPNTCATPASRGLGIYITASATADYSRLILTALNGIYLDGTVKINNNTAWHAGNDGSGSGLDADKLDGQEGSYYATASSVTTLQGYFTNGVAKSAAKLTTVSKTAWGRTFWTANGVPDSISGDMSSVGNISFSASGKNIGGLLYFDTTNGRLGVGVTSPLYKLHVGGDIVANGGVAAKGIASMSMSGGGGAAGAVTQINVGSTPYTPTDGIVTLPSSYPASDVSAWAKASTRPAYTTNLVATSSAASLTLAFGSKYNLSAGDTSFIFGMPSLPSATTGQAGIAQLSSAVNSTSETLAATAKAVKTAYDLADGKANTKLNFSTSTASSLTMQAAVQSTYVLWYTSSATSVTLAQASGTIGNAYGDIVHYMLFRNNGTSSLTITMSKYNNSNYYLIAPAKSFVVPANSSVEISYVHLISGASRFTVVTIGDVMSDIS